MSQSDVSRSERVLNAIGAKVGLTECGRDWLIACCDPYHDKPLNVCGYPDVNEAASVTQVVKLSTQISAPSGVMGNWDCHVHQFPWLGGASSVNPSLVAGQDEATAFILSNVAASGSKWSGLSIDSVAAGNPTFHYANTTITSPFQDQLHPYLSNEYRVIAMGFEVINTTAELTTQGLVTCYRSPMEDLDSAKAMFVGFSNQGTSPSVNGLSWQDVLRTSAPPDSASGALLLEGSRQWKAKDGAYIVSTLNSSELPTGGNNTSLIINLNTSDVVSGKTTAITSPGVLDNIGFPPTSSTVTIQLLTAPQTNLTKFNHSGAYFQGLSNTATLQVNTIYIIERFPTNLETDLVVLAKPSCRADAAALELYSEVIRQMPVGVPQKMNGLGEWFSDAVSAASDFLSPVLSAIPHPYAQGASAALKGGAGMLKKVMGSEVSPGQTYQARPQVARVPKQVIVVQTKKKAKVAKPVGKKKK